MDPDKRPDPAETLTELIAGQQDRTERTDGVLDAAYTTTDAVTANFRFTEGAGMSANPEGGDYVPDAPRDRMLVWSVNGEPCPECREPNVHHAACPVSVAQDAPDATETPTRTPGESGTADGAGEDTRDGDEGASEAPRRRRSCVAAWPDCSEGDYNPYCCRFPKSCSCTIYDPARVADADLEPKGDI